MVLQTKLETFWVHMLQTACNGSCWKLLDMDPGACWWHHFASFPDTFDHVSSCNIEDDITPLLTQVDGGFGSCSHHSDCSGFGLARHLATKSRMSKSVQTWHFRAEQSNHNKDVVRTLELNQTFVRLHGILKLMWEKNGKMGVSGRVCWYVACYDFVLGFNVSSLVLMIFQVGFWGSFWC